MFFSRESSETSFIIWNTKYEENGIFQQVHNRHQALNISYNILFYYDFRESWTYMSHSLNHTTIWLSCHKYKNMFSVHNSGWITVEKKKNPKWFSSLCNKIVSTLHVRVEYRILNTDSCWFTLYNVHAPV